MTAIGRYRIELPTIGAPDARPVVVAQDFRPVSVRLVGEVSEVRSAIRSANDQGTLVEHGIPRRLKDGRYAVEVTVMQPFDQSHAVKAPVFTRARLVVAGGVVLAVGAVSYGAVLLFDWIWSSGPVLAGAAVLLLLPGALVAVKKGCEGTHCGGCSS